jgi:2-C-methyl-D-erythritol 4-phosphate cytidylyltransferase
MSINIQLLIAAGGMGERLGHSTPKALAPLAGRPLLIRTLDRFNALSLLDNACITAPEASLDDFSSVVKKAYPDNTIHIIAGGSTRQASVQNGLHALDKQTQLVVIHDAARPFPLIDAVREAIEAAIAYGASTVAVPCTDTILRGNQEAMLVETPDRNALWACQTPQVFRVEVIRDAHEHALTKGLTGTDDATLVQLNNGHVKLIRGDAMNFKITSKDDLHYAEYLLKEGKV